ncbi:hypothetical protein ABW20_dc0100095 [Dactylellina cionopaga]|nr:hypothetical protein ABW20_dc0100095 [Dactylellina cionopaga]
MDKKSIKDEYIFEEKMQPRKMPVLPRNDFIRDPLRYTQVSLSQDADQNNKGPKSPEEILKLGESTDKCLMLGMGSDITLTINHKKGFRLHRFILSQALLFRRQFEKYIVHDTKESINWDSLDEFVDMEAVEHVINRMYGNFGDKYYECKNLIGIMGVCIQFELLEYFHTYLDRYLARLSVDSLFPLLKFAMDPSYGEWIEPHIIPVIKHYMARYGTHLGLPLWRCLPIDLIVQILSYDGFIYAGPHINDKRKELGYCGVIMGQEFQRWAFAKDLYYDRLGLNNESLRRLDEDGTLPTHITQALIEEQRPLFDLLNSDKFHYGNMDPFQWKLVRKERLLNVSLLIRPDVLADGIFEGVRLRHCVENIDLDSKKLNICFPADTSIPDDVPIYEIPQVDRFLYRPRRIELDKDPIPEFLDECDSSTGSGLGFDELCTIPPVRFSVEFQFHHGIGSVSANVPLCAEPVFYGGSWWLFWIQRTTDDSEPADRINMYIRRIGEPTDQAESESSGASQKSWATFADINYSEATRDALRGRFDNKLLDELLEGESSREFYSDDRQTVKAYFRIFAPSAIAGYDPEKFILISGKESPKMCSPAITRTTIYESKPMDFAIDTDVVVPGRLLVSEVEEAEELKCFSSDSKYFEKEVERIMKGEPIALPKQREGHLVKAYHRSGEVGNEWHDMKMGPDTPVVRALQERDLVWSNLKFAIVIGLV